MRSYQGIVIALLLVTPLLPAFAQESTMNKSEHYDIVGVPFSAFNVARNNATLFTLPHEHVTNWELEIQNKLAYAKPDATTVVRLYEDPSIQKYIEIGMGGAPSYRFWVAVSTPQDGYFLIHDDNTNGWRPGDVVTVTHSSNAGLSVSAGSSVKVDDLDVNGFTVRDFTVFGEGSDSDLQVANGGTLNLSIVSGNPAANPIFYMPTILLAGTAALVVVLLYTKRRR